MAEILSAIVEAFHVVRHPLGAGLALAGALLAIIGAVGMLRFPDFYSRLHAASVIDTGAVTVMVVGMALMSPSGWIVLKLVFIWLFLFLTGPTASHAIANAAYTAGLEPRIGRQTPEAGTSLDRGHDKGDGH